MATFNEKTMEIELTAEDREIMQKGVKLNVPAVMNNIIWGNREGIMSVKKSDDNKKSNS